jgi:hypothetical protein
VEGGFLVGHGGRNGRQCRLESSLDVAEDGYDVLGEARALSRNGTTCIIGRNNSKLPLRATNALSGASVRVPAMYNYHASLAVP